MRGTGLGSLLGILPGGGALLASFAAYMLEKKVAKPPRFFGAGDIRGVAAPESANNAGAQTSFIPMLTLGIPSNPTMALMIGALMIQGIQPGPQVMTERPALFWGLIASMWIGNLMLLVLNLPLVGLWIRLLAVPYRLLFPAIFVFCCIGVYTVDSKIFDIYAIADDGREPATHDDDLVRRPLGVLHPVAVGLVPDRIGADARCHRAAVAARQARGGDAGVVGDPHQDGDGAATVPINDRPAVRAGRPPSAAGHPGSPGTG
jgi:hypothetical protein